MAENYQQAAKAIIQLIGMITLYRSPIVKRGYGLF